MLCVKGLLLLDSLWSVSEHKVSCGGTSKASSNKIFAITSHLFLSVLRTLALTLIFPLSGARGVVADCELLVLETNRGVTAGMLPPPP